MGKERILEEVVAFISYNTNLSKSGFQGNVQRLMTACFVSRSAHHQCTKVPVFPHPSKPIIFCHFDDDHPTGYEVGSHGFDLHFSNG